MTKIVFMGTPQFSVEVLQGLLTAGYQVCAVCTQPDRPVGRKKNIQAPPVKELAIKHQLEVLQPERLVGSPELSRLQELAPDLIITAAFGQFLPQEVLAIPKVGTINVHASLLPKYRGGAPVHYALMNGERETGISIMETVIEMDAGPILRQQKLSIETDDNVGSLFAKLSRLGTSLLLETLPDYLAGRIQPRAQDNQLATFSPTITKEDEQIQWQKPARDLHNQVRGMYPWPVAYTQIAGQRLKIQQTEVANLTTTETAGTIIVKDKQQLVIACGGGTSLALLQVQPAGKGVLTIKEYNNGVGRQLQVGDKLGI